MEIRNIRHIGLRNFVVKGQTKGLPAESIEKIRDIIGSLLDMAAIEEILDLTKYKPHRLSGDRAGTLALSVTPNWLITLDHDAKADQIVDLDFEDYH